MNRAAILALALISIATPAAAEQCVVIHQEGMVRNATPAELRSREHRRVPCYLTDDDAVRWYFRKLHERVRMSFARSVAAILDVKRNDRLPGRR